MAIANLQQYYARIYDTLYSRRDCDVEELVLEEFELEHLVVIQGRIRFWDDSTLHFTETLAMRGVVLARTRYAYQYQDGHERLLFRYDNSPHHPQVTTFPNHKHIVDVRRGVERIQATIAPNLSDVLIEIHGVLYPRDE